MSSKSKPVYAIYDKNHCRFCDEEESFDIAMKKLQFGEDNGLCFPIAVADYTGKPLWIKPFIKSDEDFNEVCKVMVACCKRESCAVKEKNNAL